jgi:hypothetical protein
VSARDTILLALTRYHREQPDPRTAAEETLAEYNAAGTGLLRDFAPVWTRSDGSDVPAAELRNKVCGCLVQGVGPHTLLDLMALANQHNCQNNRKDVRP